ncbi:MAG: hypothetical protein A3A33_00115 [Candidatus Yanofskybacteria bacterium RIFCSPLOWO2_01_FULL_49_25]|uniref:Zinc finger DksA/TraR C4-type domain-containing protein n=1 Tax=Candidatus Yanofskybacteria bacterium RIFCSPLOWO2_01_FULL_49_25 TaxID=1802701 RepID=A0A1F8GX77_9BACT|nr:MAG: hypothetical protein A3A33_00115 [Candidatus Yanofskybacteria bacterium RIFCSPLOWO2_01_FULL_49_25]
MDQQQLAKLKQDLLEEKARIEEELRGIATPNPLVKGDWVASASVKSDSSEPMDDRAHSVTDFEERRAVEQNLELRLKDINQTLARIDAGTYSVCTNCKSSIEPKRLLAIPTGALCMNCSQKTTLT